MNINRLLGLSILVFMCNFLLLPTGYAETKENSTGGQGGQDGPGTEDIHTEKFQKEGASKAEQDPSKKRKAAPKSAAKVNPKKGGNSTKDQTVNHSSKEDSKAKEKAKKAAELLKQIKKEKKALLKQIKLLDISLEENEAQSKELKKKIISSIEKRDTYHEEIKSLKLSINKRRDLLKERALSIQEGNGSSNYLEVLLDSTSFTSFMQRLDIMSAFIEADQANLEQQRTEMQRLKEKEEQVQKQIDTLKKSKVDLESVKEIILNQQKQQQDLLKLINTKKITATKQLKDLQDILYRLPSNAPTPQGSLPGLAKIGYRWIGNSVYVFGGGRNTGDVARGIFDCSSFVYWAFEQNGVKLGDRHSVSTETLNKMGKRISPSEMKPGDIVFFDTYKADGHVGIYVGNGKFIGAQSSTGVAVADMASGYFKSKFKGHVRRIKIIYHSKQEMLYNRSPV